MKIGTKVLAGFILMALIAGTIGGVGILNINKVADEDTLLYKKMTIPLVDLCNIISAFQRSRVDLRALIQAENEQESQKRFASLRDLAVEIDKSADNYQKIISTKEGQRVFDVFRKAKKEYQGTVDRITERMAAGKQAEAAALLKQTSDSADRMKKAIEGLAARRVQRAKATSDMNTAAARTAGLVMAILLAMGAGLALAMGFLIKRDVAGIIKGILHESRHLVEEIVEGKLDTRGDIEKINDEFREIVEGTNRLIDAFAGPINVTADYVDRISKGDIPPKISDACKGDFNEIKNNLNQCIDAFNALVFDANVLTKATLAGRLDTRADASKHGGDFGRIIGGMNRSLDSLVRHIDKMPAPALILGKDFSIRYINQTGADLLGLSKERLLGAKCFDHFKTADCRTEKCACFRAMHRGQTATSETEAHPCGMSLEISYTGVPIRDEDGSIIGAFEFIIDQTAITQAVQLARKVADFGGREVQKLNEIFDRLSQGDLNISIEANEGDCGIEDTRQEFQRLYEAINLNIEKMRRALSMTVQSQKLESIGQLAAGIAHEINTPIQFVGDNLFFLKDSFAELIGALPKKEDVEGKIDLDYLLSEIPLAIAQSLDGIDRVSKIVHAMKDFSHSSQGEKSPVDINRAIETATIVSRNEWKYVASLETDFDQNLPMVSCMGDEFNQVLLNLLINAAHAIEERHDQEMGAIKVTTRQNDGWVEIRIGDTGKGIPEAIRKKIFDPFFTTKAVGKGTGQGLAIAHDIVVNKHGGSIDFESETNKGTTFIIRLPVAPGIG